MSRIGKNPIAIPANVTVTVDEGVVSAKGPLGELSLEIPASFAVKVEEGVLAVEVVKKRADTPARWGLYRSLLANIVAGVAEGFQKKLEIQGVGYRAEMKGEELVLHLGFSHPVVLKVPEGLKVSLEGQNAITVSGADKQSVGQFAADIRSYRTPEPYKGKGIRYEGEHVRRKVGKRAAA